MTTLSHAISAFDHLLGDTTIPAFTALDAVMPRYNLTGNGKSALDLRWREPFTGGELRFRWQCHPCRPEQADDHLAYRFEALVMRRRLDARRRRGEELPNYLYLGALDDMATLLGVDEAAIDRVIRQMGGVSARCDVDRYDDAVKTHSAYACLPHYGVMVTWLSAERRAVWLELAGLLTDKFVLVAPQPFDYDFARTLPAPTLRCYEVLSDEAHRAHSAGEGQGEVRMPYRDYCLLISARRHDARAEAEASLQALHAPLVARGYLRAIELVAAAAAVGESGRGRRRWDVRFVLGERAADEARLFADGADLDPAEDEPSRETSGVGWADFFDTFDLSESRLFGDRVEA